jgi:predicted nucleic acid-binding protein
LRYSIDTSALLEAWRRRYPPDVFPAVWQRLDEVIEKGDRGASEEVFLELEKRDDDVHGWAKERKMKLFVPIDEDQQRHVSVILEQHERLVDTRKNRSAADPFVIAVAIAQGCAVVTDEAATGKPEKPNIPDVCSAMGVRAMNLLEFFRQQGWRF